MADYVHAVDAEDGLIRDARLEPLLESTRRQAAGCGFYFDFDGTLSEIQIDPESVRPVPGTLNALRQLSAVVRTVGIVSARPVSFLLPRFRDVSGIALHGLYGLETHSNGRTVVAPGAAPWSLVVRDLLQDASDQLPGDVLVEDKGLAMAVHYRRAPRHEAVAVAWGERQARRYGMALEIGPMTVELRPPLQRDKGSVMAEELDTLDCAWYFGDGAPDLAAFQALDDWYAAVPNRTSVRVAVSHPDSSDLLLQRADLVVRSPLAVPRFLGSVCSALAQRPCG